MPKPVARPRYNRPENKKWESNKYAPQRKFCAFCADKVAVVDYKDAAKLRRYISDRGKIEPRRRTGRPDTDALRQRRHRPPLTRFRARPAGGQRFHDVRNLEAPFRPARLLSGGLRRDFGPFRLGGPPVLLRSLAAENPGVGFGGADENLQFTLHLEPEKPPGESNRIGFGLPACLEMDAPQAVPQGREMPAGIALRWINERAGKRSGGEK
jgi:ribosomal protein S18